MKRWIYISGILLFISFILILADDFNQEWKRVQIDFSEIDENRFHSMTTDGPSVNPGIKQIVVEGLSIVDRCPTCHLGIESNKYRKAPSPFNTHPGNLLSIHKSKDFGCTSCHFGQGYAVSYEKAAHEKLDFWNETMLPGELIQASCGTCHQSEEVPEANILTDGRLLIKDKGCTGCHDINRFFEEETNGPDLDGIGNKVTRGWLFHWLKNPKDYLSNSRMPTFRFSDEEIYDLVEFLMSLDGKNSPPNYIGRLPSGLGDEDSGKILVSESRCITCHNIHGRGGNFAPELERIGDKVSEIWLPNFVRNVHYYQPEKKMLEYYFSDQNALDIAAYLIEDFSEDEYIFPGDTVKTDIPQSPSRIQEQIRHGERLFEKYGCGGCHNIAGKNKSIKIGPKLTNIGNRLESSLNFGSYDDIVPTLYNWIFMKLKQPDVFDSTGIMPNFYFTDKEAFEITIAMLGNKEKNYSTEYLVKESEKSLYKKPAGEFGELFERYSCISCHSIDRYGGTISTVPLTIEGSIVKFEWLRDYLIRPYAVRPILPERMPHFRMTEREASLMAEYIKKVYISDDIPRFFEFELEPTDIETGRRIIDSLQCVNCHIIDGKGGYLGPTLDDCGNRLEAGWVYSWMIDPQKYRPATIQPNFGFSHIESRQITAALMAMKKENK